jgi:hypothetical protein
VYNALIGFEVQIASQVVRNLVHVEVLPEAAAALKSSRLAPWTREPIQKFVDDQLLSRQAPPRCLGLYLRLFLLTNLHRHVEYFALDFASQALAETFSTRRCQCDAGEFPTTLMSYIEYSVRSIDSRYTVTYSEPAKPPLPLTSMEHQGVFFSKFSPWENEQLGCIHDYLFNAVSPGMHHAAFVPVSTLTVSAFNEITDHDVAWGASGIEECFRLGFAVYTARPCL